MSSQPYCADNAPMIYDPEISLISQCVNDRYSYSNSSGDHFIPFQIGENLWRITMHKNIKQYPQNLFFQINATFDLEPEGTVDNETIQFKRTGVSEDEIVEILEELYDLATKKPCIKQHESTYNLRSRSITFSLSK